MRGGGRARRPYDSPHRRGQARATRRAILDAARGLFTEHGYGATTIDGIASRAGVSPESVYASFGNKRTLLSELVDVSIAGGQDERPVLDQAWVREMRAEADPRRRLAILARNGRRILERRAAIDAVVDGAAATDPAIAELAERGKKQRYRGQRRILEMAFGDSSLRKGLTMGAAADILYAIGSPETYRLLVFDRGWSGARFERWYDETLARLLLQAAGASQQGKADEPSSVGAGSRLAGEEGFEPSIS